MRVNEQGTEFKDKNVSVAIVERTAGSLLHAARRFFFFFFLFFWLEDALRIYERLEKAAAGISINGSDDSTAIIRRHRVSSMDYRCSGRVEHRRLDLLTPIREYSLPSQPGT